MSVETSQVYDDPQALNELVKDSINEAAHDSSYRLLAIQLDIPHTSVYYYSKHGLDRLHIERLIKLLNFAGLQIVKK